MDSTSENSSNAVNPQIWVEKYHDFLFRYALSRLREADLAEEIIQETFLAALHSQKYFRGMASEKTWLVSILRRKIYDHFRKVNRDRQLNAVHFMETIRIDVFESKRGAAVKSSIWFFDPSKAYEQKEFLKIIKDCLSELPGRLAQVFILREIIELSSQEICELMDISICNLYVMTHRARKRMGHNVQLKWLCETENPLT